MINGERIRQARELRGLTQTELAELVAVKQPAIAQMEAGRTQPSSSVLQAIALATNFPISFFEQLNGPDFPMGSLLFRAHASTTAQQKTQAWRYAEILHETADKMASHIETRHVRLPRLASEPVSAAREARSAFGLSPDRPIPNLIGAIEKGAVLVLIVPADLERRDAFSAWVGQEPTKPVIIISSGRPGDRLRFSIAHELGHLVMHRARQGDARAIEQQADKFAAELLMPEVAMRAELVHPITLTTIAPLKPRWGVSLQALIRRAHDLEIITPRQYHYLFEQLGAHGWKKREPQNLDVSVEKPRAVRKMAELLYGIPINYKRLSEDVSLSPTFLRELIEVYAENRQGNEVNSSRAMTGKTPSRVLSFPRRTA